MYSKEEEEEEKNNSHVWYKFICIHILLCLRGFFQSLDNIQLQLS